jgi:hypothetical protein
MNLDPFDELLDAYLLGELSEAQSAQLQQALETDSAARQRFVQSILIDARLHRLARSEPSILAADPQPAPETGSRRRMMLRGIARPRRLAWAAAFLIAISAAATFYFVRQGSSTSAQVASGKVLVDGQSKDRIAEGSAFVVAGPAPAVIDLPDGSRATLDPATQLTLRGRVESTRQVLQLNAGGGVFQVPHGGGQFRIDTPAGSVTVLGTRFTAMLRLPRSLFVSVAEGTIRFDSDNDSFTLSAGQSRTFGPEPDRPRPPTPGVADVRIEEGWIQTVDLKSGRFVLGGQNERQTTLRFGVNPGEWESIALLDGRKATFQAAIQPGRKATVACVQVGEDLWVSKVEVTSTAR